MPIFVIEDHNVRLAFMPIVLSSWNKVVIIIIIASDCFSIGVFFFPLDTRLSYCNQNANNNFFFSQWHRAAMIHDWGKSSYSKTVLLIGSKVKKETLRVLFTHLITNCN